MNKALILTTLLAAPSTFVLGGRVQTKSAVEVAISGNAATLDLNTANVFHIDLAAASGNVTITLNNAVDGASYVVAVEQDDTARTITWAAGTGTIKWSGGSQPTQTAAEDHIDAYSFLYIASTGWLMASAVQDFQN